MARHLKLRVVKAMRWCTGRDGTEHRIAIWVKHILRLLLRTAHRCLMLMLLEIGHRLVRM